MSKLDESEKSAAVRRERGATTVYQALREEIFNLQREPGSGLDEVGIAKEFNLSRTPVREALFMLSGEGLVHVLPNRASIVAPLTMHRLNDLLDTWLILTRAVCVDAAHRRTPDDLVDLDDRVVQFEVAIEAGDILGIAKAMLHLQRGYGEVARNFFLGRYYPLCLDAGRRTLLLHYFPYASAADLAHQTTTHRAMITAIRVNDTVACNKIAGEMLAAILSVIKSSLEPSIADEVDLVTSPLSHAAPPEKMKDAPLMDNSQRIAKLSKLLKAADCPAIAFVPGPNFYYLTGVSLALMERPTILIVTAEGDVHAAIPALERDRWAAEVPHAHTVYWQDSDGYSDALAELAKQVGYAPLAVEGNRMRQFEAAALSAAFGSAVSDGTAMLASLRLIKEPEEVSAIQRAVDLSEAALVATLAQVRAGNSETEIRARLQIEMLARGADGPGFDLIVLAGGASADCHGIPSSERILKPGDALLFDFGAKLNGYSADITRTYFCEEVPEPHRRLYEVVLEANRVGREMVAPGIAIHDLDHAVQSVLRDAGYDANIRHKVGHGLGLDIHEAPQLMVGNHETLQEGMVITIEPGLYEPDVIGVRIEDDVLVTDSGAKSLTSLPRELQVIGR